MSSEDNLLPLIVEPDNWPLWLGEEGRGAARLMVPGDEDDPRSVEAADTLRKNLLRIGWDRITDKMQRQDALSAPKAEAVEKLAGDEDGKFEASEVEGQVAAGRLRVLTVLAPERLEGMLAEVPTARESGIDVTWVTWRGFYVPGDIEDTEYDRWVEVLRLVAASDEWEEMRLRSRLQPFFMVGDEFESFVRSQVDEFRTMSRQIGLIP